MRLRSEKHSANITKRGLVSQPEKVSALVYCGRVVQAVVTPVARGLWMM